MRESVEFEGVVYNLDDSVYRHSFIHGMLYVYVSDSGKEIDYVGSQDFWFINNKKYFYDGVSFTEEVVSDEPPSLEFDKIIPKEVKSTFARVLSNCTFSGQIKDFV